MMDVSYAAPLQRPLGVQTATAATHVVGRQTSHDGMEPILPSLEALELVLDGRPGRACGLDNWPGEASLRCRHWAEATIAVGEQEPAMGRVNSAARQIDDGGGVRAGTSGDGGHTHPAYVLPQVAAPAKKAALT